MRIPVTLVEQATGRTSRERLRRLYVVLSLSLSRFLPGSRIYSRKTLEKGTAGVIAYSIISQERWPHARLPGRSLFGPEVSMQSVSWFRELRLERVGRLVGDVRCR